jgi:hypothetical protein
LLGSLSDVDIPSSKGGQNPIEARKEVGAIGERGPASTNRMTPQVNPVG